MKTELIMVGKTADKHFQAGIDDYSRRIVHYMPFAITVVPYLKSTRNISEEQQKQAEGEQILRFTINPGNCNIDKVELECTSTGIDEVGLSQSADDEVKYNLSGQKINANYRGIVVSKGRKILRK